MHFATPAADWSQTAGEQGADARIFVCRKKLRSGSSQQGAAQGDHQTLDGFEKSLE
jgi:hypothetical protein